MRFRRQRNTTLKGGILKHLKILKITIENFKGIEYLEIEPDGKNISIFGDNGLCKTTIFDAFSWLHSGKDSSGKANFQIKPCDKDQNNIHHLNTSVEILFDFSGEEIKLKKVFYENYVKKRGTANKIFDGHKTDYFIDELIETKTSFSKKMNKMINPDIFKILSDPLEFSGESFKWEKRRSILFQICGVSEDSEIENLDKVKKTLAARMLKTNEQIKKIDPQIKERKRDIVKLDPVDTDLKKKLNDNLKLEKESLRKTQANEKASDLRVNISEIDSAKIEAKNKHNEKVAAEKAKKTDSLNKEITSLSQEVSNIDSDIKKVNRSIKNDLEDDISNIKLKLEKLAEKYTFEEAKEIEVSTECPTCKQDLPEEDIEETKENLNLQKSEKLEEMDVKGKDLGSKKKKLESDIESLKKSNKEREISLDKKKKDLESKKLNLQEIDESIEHDLKEFDSSLFEEKKDKIQKEIDKLELGSKELEEKIEDEINLIKDDLKKIADLEVEHKKVADANTRIKTLGVEEKELSKAYEELEKEMCGIEKNMVQKIEEIDGQINSKFKLAKFKLFNEQVNGEIKQCCETIHDGIKYNHGLNNAARINVGLDIISKLSEFYGFKVPVFADNAESVNELFDIDTQLIRLVVSKDKELVIK